ncbi:MAG: MMPL family transporter [Verrucomicrobia bacterium]|nr:MMPL family transporter [Verrucomicrobiota bacterium]
MDTPPPSLVVRALQVLADAVYRYRWWFLYPQVALLALSIFYTVTHLKFSTDRNDLVGSDKEYHKYFLQFKKEFPVQDDLVVVVEGEVLEKNRQFVERLGAKLKAEPKFFTDVIFKHDIQMLGSKALLFFPEDKLREFQSALHEYQPLIRTFTQATNLNSLFRLVNQQFRTASRKPTADSESLVRAIPALERIVNQAADSLGRAGTPPSPGVTALFDPSQEAEASQYITYATNRIYLVTARPASDDVIEAAVVRLRELVHETQTEVPGLNVGLTGEAVLEFDEMVQSQRDTTVATIVSLLIVALIFIYAYRETGRPIKATLCLIVGLGYTMGFATLTIGHLNILTITFLPMLVGLAIDFGVHLTTRYEEELRKGRTEREALEKAMVNTGQGIFTGCFTTAGAFLAMSFTDFRGIREMGIISGGGLLVCLVPMMTLLPVLLLRGRQNVLDHHVPAAVDRRARIERLWLERPALVAGLTATLCGLALTQFPKVRFDYNLLNMQSQNLPAVVFIKKLIASESKSVLFAAVLTDSLEQAVAMEKKLTNLTTVASIDSLSSSLSEDQTGKLALVGEIKKDVAPLNFAPVDPEPVTVAELRQTLTFFHSYLWWADGEVRAEGDLSLLAQLRALRQAVERLQQRMAAGDPDQVADQLGAFQQALFHDISETFAAIKNQDDRAPLRPDDLPPPLKNRFIGRTGKHLIMVYPKEDVWERAPQVRFVGELRQLVHDVTGTPVQLLEYTSLLKDSYIEAAYYALGAIVVLVLIHFRALTSVLLALMPVAIGTVWLVGLMGWFEIPFNPANIMTLPLVIGVGVTNGIHILNRYAEEKHPGILAKSTGKAVLVSGLTTIVGFGSLVLAKHQGIESLGYVMASGTATCLVAGLTFLPALLNLMIRRGWK